MSMTRPPGNVRRKGSLGLLMCRVCSARSRFGDVSSCERSGMWSSVRLADIHKRVPAYGTEGLTLLYRRDYAARGVGEYGLG